MRKVFFRLSALLLCVFLIGCLAKDKYTYQAEPLTTSHFDKAAAETVFNTITSYTNVLSFTVMKDDELLCEYYAKGNNRDTVYKLNSCSKSFTSALIGIAIDEGLIESVDTKIIDYFPELGANNKDLPLKQQVAETGKTGITIRHLLTMTTGWDWPEWTDWNYGFGDWYLASNKVQFVLEREQLREPGRSFNYDTGASQLLCAIIGKVSGMPADEYAKIKIFDKIGIKSARWSRDLQGVTDGGFGISMTPVDALKFGKLYLNRGQWNGEQIVSEDWVALSTSRHSSGNAAFSPYGMHWWVGSVIADKQYDMFYAMGFGGQYILVVPELHITAVFTCSGTDAVSPLRYFKSFVRALTM